MNRQLRALVVGGCHDGQWVETELLPGFYARLANGTTYEVHTCHAGEDHFYLLSPQGTTPAEQLRAVLEHYHQTRTPHRDPSPP